MRKQWTNIFQKTERNKNLSRILHLADVLFKVFLDTHRKEMSSLADLYYKEHWRNFIRHEGNNIHLKVKNIKKDCQKFQITKLEQTLASDTKAYFDIQFKELIRQSDIIILLYYGDLWLVSGSKY